MLVHFQDSETNKPDAWRWDDRVWSFARKGDRLEWTENPIVQFDDDSGRFEAMRGGRAARVIAAWEPNASQIADIQDGLAVNSRGSKTKTLRPGAGGKRWSSGGGGGADSAMVITYTENWSIEGLPDAPVFTRDDSMGGASAESMQGSTRYKAESVSPDGNEIRGSFDRDGTRKRSLPADPHLGARSNDGVEGPEGTAAQDIRPHAGQLRRDARVDTRTRPAGSRIARRLGQRRGGRQTHRGGDPGGSSLGLCRRRRKGLHQAGCGTLLCVRHAQCEARRQRPLPPSVRLEGAARARPRRQRRHGIRPLRQSRVESTGRSCFARRSHEVRVRLVDAGRHCRRRCARWQGRARRGRVR